MEKTILITGASSGIGYATAELFAQNGWNVIATVRKKKDGRPFLGYQNILVARLDVTKPDTISLALQEGIEKFGKIDVLLNNAGYGAYGILEDATEEIIQQQLDTNLFGVIRTIKSILPHFRKNKEGMIINLTSVGGRIALPYLSLYYTSKWAVEGLSEALKFELMPIGVKVKVIEPGIVYTDFGKKSYDFSEHELKEYEPINDKAREVLFQLSNGVQGSKPDEIAETIYTAATDHSMQLRYPAGNDAKALMKIREELSDESFFALVESVLQEKNEL